MSVMPTSLQPSVKLFQTLIIGVVFTFLITPLLEASEWSHWRGPHHNGVADDANLVTSWSKAGPELIWRDDFTGRSTPVVFDGRVCATGRHGEGIDRQEVAACWDAETGEKLWQQQWNVYLTSVPWTRVSWGDPAGDSETGYLYVQGVHGHFIAFDREGNRAWEWMMGEDLGRFSGYGGRTNSPIVDEDRVIVHSISSMWGPHRPGGDRYIAFDKVTGEIQWITPRNGPPAGDLNTYSTPIITEIGGRRLMIAGGADGWIRALDSRSGEDIWKFHLSRRGLNSSVVVEGTTVFATHSEENLDSGVMGRVVAINGIGSGDITETNELWRVEGLQAGYASPTVVDGVLYVPDNSANIHALDTKTGEEHWVINYGTVGKGSPVYADGHLYVTEVNGNVVTIALGDDEPSIVDREHLEVPDGRYAEIYGSHAIANGRIYFTTEEGIYCLGSQDRAESASSSAMTASKTAKGTGAPALLRVVPAVVVASAGDQIDFRVEGFDQSGAPLGSLDGATWALSESLSGSFDSGVLKLDSKGTASTVVGTVTAKLGELEAVSHLRVAGPLPWSEDFNAIEDGEAPASWLGLGKGARVRTIEDEKILVQPKAARGAPRATILLGPSSMSGYTVQADFKGNRAGRKLTDSGLVNSGYTFEVMGAHQRIQISSWASERRMAQRFPFEWEIGVWYRMKMRVDYVGTGDGQKAVIRGKVWPRDEEEPAAWTASAEDPHPILSGSPGLYTFAPVESYFDNVVVTTSGAL